MQNVLVDLDTQVQDATVTCRMCRETFHATGCDKDTDMCGKTFLRMYHYLTEKASGGEAKPGSFAFICKACLSVFASLPPPVQNTTGQYLVSVFEAMEKFSFFLKLWKKMVTPVTDW